MSSAETGGPLTDRERQEWHAALMLGDILRARVSAVMMPATGLSGPDYLVLTRLTNAPEHRWSGLKALATKMGQPPVPPAQAHGEAPTRRHPAVLHR